MTHRISSSSLRTRLAIWIALIAAGMTFIGVSVGFLSGYNYLARSHEQSIRSHMRLAAVSLAPAIEAVDYLGLRRQLELVMEYEGIEGIRIQDQNGHQIMERGVMTAHVLIEPIFVNSQSVGWIEVGFSRSPLQTGILYILMVGVLLFLCFVPIFIYLVWRISGHYLLDLSRLTTQISADFQEDLPDYPGETRRDEIGVLASALRRRDQALASNIRALEQYKTQLEEMVEQRTAQLRQSELLSRTILGSIPEAIALVDMDSMSILDVNHAFTKFYRMSRSELVGTDFQNVAKRAGLSDGSENACPIQKFLETRSPCVLQKEHQDAEGEVLFLEVSAWPVFNDQNEIRQMVCVQRDITEQRRVANLRKDVERIVQHDLKTPLVGIIGLAGLLEGETPERQKVFISHILDSARRMMEMITNSMDLFNMEEGRYILQPAPFNLTAVIRALDQETESLRNQSNLSVVYLLNDHPLDWNTPLEMLGERRNIHSMLTNLLNNALEAAPAGSQVSLNIRPSEENWVMDIHNLGVIPEEVRERFFERYATAGKSRGTGLGTYSAMLIARTHGGKISFTSTEAEGTHVTVTLPKNDHTSALL
ncbi:PAS domain-containing sensor histidine kinase [Desulfonatronum parangueonense]